MHSAFSEALRASLAAQLVTCRFLRTSDSREDGSPSSPSAVHLAAQALQHFGQDQWATASGSWPNNAFSRSVRGVATPLKRSIHTLESTRIACRSSWRSGRPPTGGLALCRADELISQVNDPVKHGHWKGACTQCPARKQTSSIEQESGHGKDFFRHTRGQFA